MKKFIPRILKVLKIFLIVVASLYAIAYFYIRINKDKIIRQLTEEVSKKLNGKLTIGEADISLFRTFPRISVEIRDISLTDTMFATHKHPFFGAKAIYGKLNIWKLIKKDQPLTGLRIDDGSVYLFTDAAGYTNTYLLKSKKDPAGGPKKTARDISIKTIELNRMKVVLDDRQKEKLHDFDVKELDLSFNDADQNLSINADANLIINSLAFNLPRGTFLKGASFRGDFTLNYGKESQLLSFDHIDVKIGGTPFDLSGKFDLGDKNPVFSLNIIAKNVLYENVKRLLPTRIATSLSLVSLDKPLSAEANLNGPLNGGEPYILAKWNVKNSRLTSPFMDFDAASFTGFYNNEVTKGLPRKDPNSIISISNFRADWHSLPVSSDKIQILNLTFPQLIADIRSAFPLASLNQVIQTNTLKLTSGNGNVLLTYNGPMQKNNSTNSFLNGFISFSNGTVLYAPRNVELKNVNGMLSFQNSDINVKDVRFDVLSNKIVMNGTGKNLLTLINTDPNKVRIDYNIYSPSLNLASFTYLLKSNKKTARVKRENSENSANSFAAMSDKIDDIMEQSTINVSLKVDRLLYKNFEGSNVNAAISLLPDRYLIDNVSLNTAGGRMSMSGQLANNNNAINNAAVKADLAGVDVKRFFASFDNFGQQAISGQNLEGQLSATVSAGLQMSETGAVVPNSLNGMVDFSLKNGALINFEPIKKVQKYIFKNRDFENIRFAELKDRLEINRGEIKINRMEIQSSVLSLFVEGLYSPKGNTDISIQVPLNNLKKRSADLDPVNIGTDKKGGRSIFLRGKTGSDGNVDFKLDIFKRFQKDKEEKEKAAGAIQ